MIKFDMLNGIKNIYFIGIGGVSMSGLAMILNKQGFTVVGSDISSSDITKKLESINIRVNIGHKKEHITDDIDLVVYTAAVNGDNEELLEAKRRNINVIPRSELLGYIMYGFKYSVAISGTHGKTTTTSMISQILIDCGLDPTITIGGILPSIGSNTLVGATEYFVAEACEYCNSFLSFYPYVAVVLNIDFDHADFFENIDEVRASFRRFAENVPSGGALIINGNIEDIPQLTEGLDCNVITFGIDNLSDWQAENITFSSNGHAEFDVIQKTAGGRNYYGRFKLSVPGIHNIYNSLSAIAACDYLGVDISGKSDILSGFTGAGRRFEYKGSFRNAVVIDDYAHHPTEIKATLDSAKIQNYNRVWCVFQPHTYSRTKIFLEDFARSFENADKVIVTDIYAAREKKRDDIHSIHLVEKMKELGKDARYIKEFDDILEFLKENTDDGDVIITMGAGNVNVIGDELVRDGVLLAAASEKN